MKKILSIDGGGIRGIIPLACLVELEKIHMKPCREIFDMVAGTSTGAVIAAGIALGISARGLLALYRELAKHAFRRLPLHQIIFNLGNHRYCNAYIAKTLDEIGADRPLNSLMVDVLITAKNLETSQTDFFVKDGPGNASLWGTMTLKDAVLASIAAPTYFPAHSANVLGEGHTWVDGGVGVSGNPVYHAAVEAIHYSVGLYPPGDTLMLSFGTGRRPHPIDARSASILKWGIWVLEETMEDAGEWQTYVTRREYEQTARIDLRRYQLDMTSSVMRELGVAVPEGVDVAEIGLDSVWAADLLEDIGRTFAAKIDFNNRDGLELETQPPK